MQNHNIELTSPSSTSQLNQNHPSYANYLPQQDEDSSPEAQGEQPQNFNYEPQETLWSRFRQDKATNLAIILILCLSIIAFAPLFYGFYYFPVNSEFKEQLQKSVSKPLEFMKADLNADPIMDIQIMKKGSNCPSGYKLLKLGAWPGTKDGCLCEDGSLYGTPCDQVKAEKCEKEIPSTLPIDMFEWDASIWCLKKAVLGIDYLRNAECPSGFQECYFGGCFKKNCPITKINMNSDGVLTLANIPGELPIINIQMSFGGIPCFAQDLFAQTVKNFTYELSVIQENSCDKYGLNSHFSTKLASQTAYNSFTENYFPYSTIHLPYFEGNATTTPSILSSMVRMKIAKHEYCLDINENSINDYSDISERHNWVFFGSLFLFFINCICFLMIWCCPDNPRARTELFGEPSSIISGLRECNIVSFVLILLMLIPFHGIYQGFQVLKGDFERYNELECFAGGQGSMVINDFLEVLKDIEGGFWIYWILLGIHVSFIFIHILLYVGKKISAR